MVLSLSLSKVSLPFVSHRLEGQVEGVEDVYGMTDIQNIANVSVAIVNKILFKVGFRQLRQAILKGEVSQYSWPPV
jgi:hypothetical protein